MWSFGLVYVQAWNEMATKCHEEHNTGSWSYGINLAVNTSTEASSFGESLRHKRSNTFA